MGFVLGVRIGDPGSGGQVALLMLLLLIVLAGWGLGIGAGGVQDSRDLSSAGQGESLERLQEPPRPRQFALPWLQGFGEG